jgi:hypothetical protein
MNRKKRTDRNHIIYELTNVINGKQYLGVTQAIGRRFNYSVLRRFQKHISRAKKENWDWELYKDMRKYGPDVYDVYLIEVVRGKAEVHIKETELLQRYEYKLNSTH